MLTQFSRIFLGFPSSLSINFVLLYFIFLFLSTWVPFFLKTLPQISMKPANSIDCDSAAGKVPKTHIKFFIFRQFLAQWPLHQVQHSHNSVVLQHDFSRFFFQIKHEPERHKKKEERKILLHLKFNYDLSAKWNLLCRFFFSGKYSPNLIFEQIEQVDLIFQLFFALLVEFLIHFFVLLFRCDWMNEEIVLCLEIWRKINQISLHMRETLWLAVSVGVCF